MNFYICGGQESGGRINTSDYSNGQNSGSRTYAKKDRGKNYALGIIPKDSLQQLPNQREKFRSHRNDEGITSFLASDREVYSDNSDSDHWENNDNLKKNKVKKKPVVKVNKKNKKINNDADDDYVDEMEESYFINNTDHDYKLAKELSEVHNGYGTRGKTNRLNSNSGIIDLLDDDENNPQYSLSDYQDNDNNRHLSDSESDDYKIELDNNIILNLKNNFVKSYIDITSGLLINNQKSSIYNVKSKRYINEDRTYNNQYEIPELPENKKIDSFVNSRIRKVYFGKRIFCNDLIDNIVSIDFLNKHFIFDLMEDDAYVDNIFGVMLDKTVYKSSSVDTLNNSYKSVKNKEYIYFSDIISYHYGSIDSDNYFLAILIDENAILFNVVVGPGRCLDPNSNNSELNPSKYILLISSKIEITNLTNSLQGKNLNYITKLNSKKSFLMVNSSLKLDKEVVRQSHENELKQFNRSKKRKERNNSTDSFGTATIIESPDDGDIYCVYPIKEEASDAITICKGDLKRLAPCIYLNDNLIDLAIKIMVLELDENKRNKVHAFNCNFFSNLNNKTKSPNDVYLSVTKWTKNIDIFALDYIFIPVNEFQHWSLATIVRPGLVIDEILKLSNKTVQMESCDLEKDNVDQLLKDDDIKNELQSCIIFMDSMKAHSKNKISNLLLLYLFDEYKSKKAMNNNDINIETNFFTKSNMPIIQCNSPIQENSFDCGVYVIKYVEYILKKNPKPTKNEINNGEFQNTFSLNAFDQAEVTVKRTEIRVILDKIQSLWSVEKMERDIRNINNIDDDDDEVTEIIPYSNNKNIYYDNNYINNDDILGDKIEVQLKEQDENENRRKYVQVNLKLTDTIGDFLKNLAAETKIILQKENETCYYDSKIIEVEMPSEFGLFLPSSLLNDIKKDFKYIINEKNILFHYNVRNANPKKIIFDNNDNNNNNNDEILVVIDESSKDSIIDISNSSPKEKNFMSHIMRNGSDCVKSSLDAVYKQLNNS